MQSIIFPLKVELIARSHICNSIIPGLRIRAAHGGGLLHIREIIHNKLVWETIALYTIHFPPSLAPLGLAHNSLGNSKIYEKLLNDILLKIIDALDNFLKF